ncbi:HTH-type transcriptional activator RhaS [bioreactor metagenome]|uniref:HTH-type transcriptional activator RhaS n=1 Tax=bioreactor metagenome TaxID=1076179 RepID=A0A645BZT9_9ZZZZ|nr:AraC family transcriptional regulator [Candidatus Metalachnospira sp.]
MQIYDISINNEKMETTAHGTADFPIAIYETVLKKNILGFVDWHWHSELQFSYVTAGEVMFTVNGSSFKISKNNGLFVNSGILHTAKPLTDDASYICIDFSPSLIASFENSVIEKKYIQPYIENENFQYIILIEGNETTSSIINTLQSVFSIYKLKPFGFEAEIAIMLTQCWIKLISFESNSNDSADYFRLKHLLSYIHIHYKEKLTLNELSETIHLCPNECCRYFKKHMNCTIFDYINNYRISESTNSLLKSDLSISRIAYEYGFGSTSYYIDKFRKKTGLTPLNYRKTYK